MKTISARDTMIILGGRSFPMYDIIIIGGGPAGLTAALYAKRAGFTALLLEGGALGGQAATTPEIENWPATGHISGPDFSMALYNQAKGLGAEIKFETAAGLTDGGSVKTVTTTAHSYEARAVILANGVRRRKLEVPGEERLTGRGVSYCATCDGNFFRGKDVAVVGGGSTALEDAIFLSTLCPTVWLIHRRAAFGGEPHLVEAVRDVANIRPLLSHSVVEIEGDAKVAAIRVKGPRGSLSLPVSGVFAAVGLIPDNAPFSPPLKLDEFGYVQAGEDCRTGIPGVFAAGDTRAKALRQLVTAASDGASAAVGAGHYLHAL